MLQTQVKLVKDWFSSRGISNAIVGYSGGVDSSTTILLLAKAGITVHAVCASAPNQKYSSPYGGAPFVLNTYDNSGDAPIHCHIFNFRYPEGLDSSNAFSEAALPIIRVATFYGLAADLREKGIKSVVVGTANFSEAAFLGFWGKASDAAQDVYPISHLSKAQVYELAKELKVPSEIINAVPSGDLLFENTNHRKMIGASYDQIEEIIEASLHYSSHARVMRAVMDSVDNPKIFAENIVRNSFKYELPFPGFHLSDRLEIFRKKNYPSMLKIAKGFLNA